jgi:hypothetical protein
MTKDAPQSPAGEIPGTPSADATVERRRQPPVLAATVAAVLEVAAVALLAAGPGGRAAAVGAALLHLLAVAPLALAPGLSASERGLAAALVLTLPVAGIAVGMLALATGGRAEIAQQPPDELAAALELPDPDEARRMAEALPWCEALLEGGVEERRAVLAALTRRADADALALLRWALGAPDADLAVEAALALEDISARFEARLAAARREMREHPSHEAAMAAAEVVARAIEAGIADPSLVPSLAHEARNLYEEAARLDPVRHDATALARAKLELAVLRPDTALACIDAALPTATPDGKAALVALREEAVLASHVLPWEGPSALASYHDAMPPPLTARRRFGFPRGTRAGSGKLARRERRPGGSAPHLVVVPKGEVSHE